MTLARHLLRREPREAAALALAIALGALLFAAGAGGRSAVDAVAVNRDAPRRAPAAPYPIFLCGGAASPLIQVAALP